MFKSIPNLCTLKHIKRKNYHHLDVYIAESVKIGSGHSNNNNNSIKNGGARMGNFQEPKNKKILSRNSSEQNNNVDRVRINVNSHQENSKNFSQKSGWRQKSLSNIDLSLRSKDFQLGEGAFRYKDFDEDLSEIYSKKPKNIQNEQELDDNCNINPKAHGNKLDIIKDHNKAHFDIDSKVCSLRRTRSLAVIREETFNDLSINGPQRRRSQLIPRAKLIENRNSRSRLSYLYDGPIPEHELKDRSKHSTLSYQSWNCDLSDLGSIDSNIFKNSLHQIILDNQASLKSCKISSKAEIHHEEENSECSNSNSNIKIEEDFDNKITIVKIGDKEEIDPSIISYNSIYLSSESGQQTPVNDSLAYKISQFEQAIEGVDVNDINSTDQIIDDLYQQVSDGLLKKKQKQQKKIEDNFVSDDFLRAINEVKNSNHGIKIPIICDEVNENQTTLKNVEIKYSSLLDSDISKLLSDYELIDEKLRYENSLEPAPDYEALLLDRKSSRISEEFIDLKSLEEENPKGAPSIELVQYPIKEKFSSSDQPPDAALDNNNNNKSKIIYFPDIGVEFDYENYSTSSSVKSTTQKSLNLNLVTVSGRKVIVDELDARSGGGHQTDTFPSTAATIEKHNKKIVAVIDDADDDGLTRDKEKYTKLARNETTATTTTKEVKNCKYLQISDKKLKDSQQQEKKLEPVCSAKEEISDCKMPRPQLLNIVDTRPAANAPNNRLKNSEIETSTTCEMRKKFNGNENDENEKNKTEMEFFSRVDSVRNYWSNILQDDENFYLEKVSKSSSDIPNSFRNEEFQSFFPKVEIIELNEKQKEAVLTANNLNDVEFDHVRYKVMKSDIFKKNLLIGNGKEQHFEGLMQYLEDYSFQELLRNNNVVIIEPVRTKIENAQMHHKKSAADNSISISCKITNGATNQNQCKLKSNQKHFYYQPIRVNKELYEDELPVPDTVRNVRKMFEDSTNKSNCSKDVQASKINRLKNILPEWDSMSLSSGVSSAADLNSPCDCNHQSKTNSKDSQLHQQHKKHANITSSYNDTDCDYMKNHINKRGDISGIKLKLVKSNSCSSRLELAGTRFDTNLNTQNPTSSVISDNDCEEFTEEQEDTTVRDIVSRLESKSVHRHHQSKPRIIESKCIEKCLSKSQEILTDKFVVTKNSSIEYSTAARSEIEHKSNMHKSKITRNKDLDLAFASIMKKKEDGSMENIFSKSFKKDSVDSLEINGNDAENKKNETFGNTSPICNRMALVGNGRNGSPFEKDYLCNVNNIGKPKVFEDMEFEEFEVLSDQHYDSLNSK